VSADCRATITHVTAATQGGGDEVAAVLVIDPPDVSDHARIEEQ